MKKGRILQLVLVGAVLVVLASPAAAQGWRYNVPAGVSLTITGESPLAPYQVSLDMTVDTYDNFFYYGGSSYWYSTMPFGTQFFVDAWWDSTYAYGNLAHFVNGIGSVPTTGGGSLQIVDLPVTALNWGDGATTANVWLPSVGDGSGAFRGSFAHTYSVNNERFIRASSASSDMWRVTYNAAGPYRGAHMINIVDGADIWARYSDGSTGLFWFGGGPTTFPMGIQNTVVAYLGNAAAGGNPIPTMSWIGMFFLAILMAGAGIFIMTRR